MDEDRIYAAVKRNLLVVVPDIEPESITMDCTLDDLGLNSIDRADVLTMAMEELAISVPIMEFRRGSNIRSLVELLRKYS